jgi:8-oxo-dGTP pyrophosphatase MutT (NUDIX family)
MGVGHWNGFGGKPEAGETNLQAAQRELQEECGLEATDLTYVGVVLYVVDGRQRSNVVEVYTCTQWTGAVFESEEMRPSWFSYASFLDGSATPHSESPPMPLRQMVPESLLYLSLVLEANGPFVARVDFGREEDPAALDADGGILRYEIVRSGPSSRT